MIDGSTGSSFYYNKQTGTIVLHIFSIFAEAINNQLTVTVVFLQVKAFGEILTDTESYLPLLAAVRSQAIQALLVKLSALRKSTHQMKRRFSMQTQ
jgi:uncharacterized membrane protein (DUF4010 family)